MAQGCGYLPGNKVLALVDVLKYYYDTIVFNLLNLLFSNLILVP